MIPQIESYYFVIFPKYLQTKGFVIDRKLPQYSISVYIGHCRVDDISVIPVKEQKLYHTIFWITTGRLEFKENFNQTNWDLVRIQVHDQGQLVGKVYLNIKEYIRQFDEDKERYYLQKVKISEVYQMQFQLFMGTSRTEIDNLLIQIHGQSDIRTPITKQSQDRIRNDSELNFDLAKIASSEIYSPLEHFDQSKSIFHKIDEESSINSSVPQTAPPGFMKNRFAFKINLNQVETKEENEKNRSPMYDSGDIRKDYNLSLQERLIICLFGGFSLVAIYLSMIPLKRI